MSLSDKSGTTTDCVLSYTDKDSIQDQGDIFALKSSMLPHDYQGLIKFYDQPTVLAQNDTYFSNTSETITDCGLSTTDGKSFMTMGDITS